MRKNLALLLLFLITATAFAAESAPQKGVVNYPGVEVDLVKKEVRVQATVSTGLGWRDPLIEYVLFCGQEKDYESLFVTSAQAVHLYSGLLLLGLRPAPLPEELLQNPGKPEKNPADMPALVTVVVEWQGKDGRKRQMSLAELLKSRENGKSPRELDFVFTGSETVKNDGGKEVLAAALSGAAATLIYNPQALLNLSYVEVSPYVSDTGGFKIICSALPEEFVVEKEMADYVKGTVKRLVPTACAVTLIFKSKSK